MLCFLCFSQREVINFIKKTKIVWVLWLAERSVYMRVCKHGCDVTKMFCFSWANHTSTNLKKFFSSKLNKFTLFKPIPSSAETWKIFTNKLCQFFFFSWTDILGEKNPYFGKHLLQNKDWFNTRARLCVQDFATGKNFSFNQCHNKEFCVFSWEGYFIFTLEGLEELLTVMYTLDFVSGLHNCLKFSHHRSCLYQAMQTRKTFSIA